MGSTLCCFGCFSPERLPKQVPNNQKASQPAPIIEFNKPKSRLWTDNKQKKTQLLHPQEQQQQQQQNNIKEWSTLEEWILSSPGLKNNGSADLHVFKQFSNKVFPSLDGDHHADNYSYSASISRDSFSTERLVKDGLVKDDKEGYDGNDMLDPSLRRSQSGKLKKKVHFRFPEEADVIVFYPS